MEISDKTADARIEKKFQQVAWALPARCACVCGIFVAYPYLAHVCCLPVTYSVTYSGSWHGEERCLAHPSHVLATVTQAKIVFLGFRVVATVTQAKIVLSNWSLTRRTDHRLDTFRLKPKP